MAKLQLKAPVGAVTVYPGQARVVRRGRITLPDLATSDLSDSGTPTEVLLTDLPLTLVHESVRVTGRGAGAITGIDVRTAHRASDDSERTASLLAERQRLVIAAQEIADRRRALICVSHCSNRWRRPPASRTPNNSRPADPPTTSFPSPNGSPRS